MRKSQAVGGPGGSEYSEFENPPARLVGFNYTTGKFNNTEAIMSIQAIYRGPKGERLVGKEYGTRFGGVRTIGDKPGFVVESLFIKGSGVVELVRIAYVLEDASNSKRLKSMNPESIGNNDSNSPSKLLGGPGKKIHGIFGRYGNAIDQIGVHYTE